MADNTEVRPALLNNPERMGMKKNSFIYVAGIIDGEGCLIVSKSDRGSYDNYYGRIHVKNTDMRLMKWLVENFGGNIHVNKPKSKKHSIAYSWYFSGNAKSKEIFLLSIMPYLIIKREQAKVLVEFFRLSEQKCPELRHKLYLKMRDLNKRGPTVETNMSGTSEEVKIEPKLTGDCESGPSVN
jgi:hypothetical protein